MAVQHHADESAARESSLKAANRPQYTSLYVCLDELTFRLSLQGVAAGRLGVCWLPEHQGCVVVGLGDFRGSRSFWDTLRRSRSKSGECTPASVEAFQDKH